MTRLREAVAETPFDSTAHGLRVTVIIGISELTSGDQDLNAVITRADHALYRAKHLGRNRVSCDSLALPSEVNNCEAAS